MIGPLFTVGDVLESDVTRSDQLAHDINEIRAHRRYVMTRVSRATVALAELAAAARVWGDTGGKPTWAERTDLRSAQMDLEELLDG